MEHRQTGSARGAAPRGAVQVINTYTPIEAIARSASRAEHDMSRAVDGKADALDQETVATLGEVLASV